MDDESGESMEIMEEVPLKELGDAELESRWKLSLNYDTIRDAILTCARKPTWVGLIYRKETTTKNCKTEKLKIKSRYVRSNSKSMGNHVLSSEEEKRRLQWEGFVEKGFKSGMKERVGDEKTNNNN